MTFIQMGRGKKVKSLQRKKKTGKELWGDPRTEFLDRICTVGLALQVHV